MIPRPRMRVRLQSRTFATVDPTTIVARPPKPPLSTPPPPSALDAHILAALSTNSSPACADLSSIIHQYLQCSGRVLHLSLPYESRPAVHRRVRFDDSESGVAMVAHCVREGDDHKVTLSSAFALQSPGQEKGQSLVLTCAHTLEEIRLSSLLLPDSPLLSSRSSGSFVISDISCPTPPLHPVSAVLSALHRSDLLLLSVSGPQLRTLPVSPYPAQPYTSVRAHFVTNRAPDESGWKPWVGGMWSKWVRGTVLGYRDFAGRETKPGTYDALSHLLFHPPPTAGSSGGPIVDEESGGVVGMILGTRMDNRVEGIRGWGVPSETIFEMFSLPGLEGKS